MEIITKNKYRSQSGLKKINQQITENARAITPELRSEKVQRVMRIYYGNQLTVARSTKIVRKSPVLLDGFIAGNRSTGKLSISNVKAIKAVIDLNESSQKIDQVHNLRPRLEDSLRFEVNHAKSDLLELKRDIAVYEHNFIAEVNAANIVKQLKALTASLIYRNFEHSKPTTLVDSIKTLINKPIEFPSGKSRKKKISSEDFHVSASKAKDVNESFQGIVFISGQRCLIRVTSINRVKHKLVAYFNTQIMCLTVNSTHTTQISGQTYKSFILSDLSKLLYLRVYKAQASLIFDPAHSTSFKVIATKIKGIGLVSLKLSQNSSDCTIEILKTTLKIQRPLLPEDSILAKSDGSLQKHFSSHLWVHKNALHWTSSSNPFASIDSSSLLLTDDNLCSLLSLNLRKVFKTWTRVKGKKIKITIFSNNDILLCLKSADQKILITETSIEFNLLIALQPLKVSESPKTLCKSLELSLLISRLFNI